MAAVVDVASCAARGDARVDDVAMPSREGWSVGRSDALYSRTHESYCVYELDQ